MGRLTTGVNKKTERPAVKDRVCVNGELIIVIQEKTHLVTRRPDAQLT